MRFILVWLAATSLVSVGQAQEQPLALIEQLGSTDYRVRAKASRDLIAQGDRALPLLRAALTQIEDPVQLRRAEVLFETVRSEAAFQPTLVTVDFKNVPSKTALKELCKQAGCTCQDDVTNSKIKVTLKLTKVPFWEALETLCELTNRSLLIDNPGRTFLSRIIYLYEATTVSPFTFMTGPFRFHLDNIRRSSSIPLSNIPKRGQLNPLDTIEINGVVQMEPTRSIVGIGAVTVLSAVDDQGASLKWDRAQVPSEVPIGYCAQSKNLDCSLQCQRGTATSIRELRGKVALWLFARGTARIDHRSHSRIAANKVRLSRFRFRNPDCGRKERQLESRDDVPPTCADSERELEFWFGRAIGGAR